MEALNINPSTVEEFKDLANNNLLHGSYDLEPEAYHSINALSYSGLKSFRDTPAHYQAMLRKERKREVIGTGTHMACLEPARFARSVRKVTNRLGGNGVKAKELEADGFFVVTENEYEKISRMSDAVLKDPDARKLLTNGYAERSFFCVDPDTETNLKCRPDYIVNDEIIVDLKYFDDLDDTSLMFQIDRMRYSWQSAFYLDVVGAVLKKELSLCAHVFVMSCDPWLVRVTTLCDAALEHAREEYRPLIAQFADCKRTNQWPGYPRPENGILELTLPDNAWKRVAV